MSNYNILCIIYRAQLKKISIENIIDSPNNLSDHNLHNFLKVLNQLTAENEVTQRVGSINFTNLRKHIIGKHNSKYNKTYILVVKYDEKIIGTGSIIIENKIIRKMGKVGHIEDVVIDEQFRGLNLARRLINNLIQIAKNNDCYKIILNASDNVSGFYEKLGFEKYANSMRINIFP